MADPAMATRTEVLQGRLAVDTSAWASGLAQASSMFKGFSSGIRSGLSGAFNGAIGGLKGAFGKIGGMLRSALSTALSAGGIGGLLSGGGILAGLNNIANLGGTINDLSERTGIAASSLTVLREQFRQGGVEADSVTQYIRKMFDALDDPKKANIFASLGLDQASLSRMKPDMAFNRILDGVRKLSGQMPQANVLSDLFGGKQGINLMTLVADKNSFNSAQEMVGGMAKDMDKFAPILDRIGDILGPDGIGVKMQQVFFGILKSFSTDLLSLADKFSKLDFQAVGENIAEWLRWGWDTFQTIVANPSGLWAAMGNGFKGVSLLATSYLLGAIGTAITGGVNFAIKVLPSLAKSLWFAMKAVGGALAIGILEGLETIKEALPQQLRDGLDRVMRFGAAFSDNTPMGKLMSSLTGTTATENYKMMHDNPDIVRNAFEKGMYQDLQAAGANISQTLTKGSEVFSDAVNKFEPNAYLFAKGSEHLLQASEIFKTIPAPSQAPWQAITAASPGSTSSVPSIFNQPDGKSLSVSLDGNKIEMAGPIAVRMVTSLERIEDNLEID